MSMTTTAEQVAPAMRYIAPAGPFSIAIGGAQQAPMPPVNLTRLADLCAADQARFAHMMKSPANPRGVDPVARLPEPTGWHILVLQYVRPNDTKTAGGIILPGMTLKEDEYQGRVGVVLAVGPDAYCDKTRTPGGPWVEVGNWIAWPRMAEASAKIAFGEATLVVLQDERVLLRGVDPDAALAR
jgi:co-chaperonin GroES (HSP10)